LKTHGNQGFVRKFIILKGKIITLVDNVGMNIEYINRQKLHRLPLISGGERKNLKKGG